MKFIITAIFIIQFLNLRISSAANLLPLVINTWNFLDAGQKGKPESQKVTKASSRFSEIRLFYTLLLKIIKLTPH